MLDKLNAIYGAVVSHDVLMQRLYQVTQQWDESMSNYLICVGGVLSGIKTNSWLECLSLNLIWLLQSRFYSVLHSWICDGMRCMLKSLAYDVTALMKAA